MRDDVSEEKAWEAAQRRLGLRGRKEERQRRVTDDSTSAPELGPAHQKHAPISGFDRNETGAPTPLRDLVKVKAERRV